MRRARIVAGSLALLFGAALLFLGVQRYRLPYDGSGRYFDPQQGVVYEVQSAEVFILAGAALSVAGLLLLLRRPRR